MGCRPSRHSSGRVGDSSWENDKNGYFGNDSKKRRKMKNGCISQRKPAEFTQFSSTSKTYQRVSRNVSQCSKITLRLSTDGSVLEIEKYDIDFHSNKEELLSKNMGWCTSQAQERSTGQIVDPLSEKTQIVRCESAPQLTFLPSALNTIAEEGDEPDRFKFRLFSNGSKRKSLRLKSKGSKLKQSKTFSNGTSRNEYGQNGQIKTKRNMPKKQSKDNSRLFLNEVTSAFTEPKHCAVFDLGSESSELSKESTTETKSEKSEIENLHNSANNAKSICDEKIVIENIPQNDYIGSSSNPKSSSEAVVEDQTNAVDSRACKSGSGYAHDRTKDNAVSSEIDVIRTEIYSSINKFNEILSRRQQIQTRDVKPQNSRDNETLVSVHTATNNPTLAFQTVSQSISSNKEKPCHIQNNKHDTLDQVQTQQKADSDFVLVKGVISNGTENETNLGNPLKTNNELFIISEHENLVIDKGKTDSPTQLPDGNESCICISVPRGSDISSVPQLCKYCSRNENNCTNNSYNHRESYQNRSFLDENEGATNSTGSHNCKNTDEKYKIFDVFRANENEEEMKKYTNSKEDSDKLPNKHTSPKCEANSTNHSSIITGISKSSEGNCSQCAQLTRVATDEPLTLLNAVLTKKIDDDALVLFVKASKETTLNGIIADKKGLNFCDTPFILDNSDENNAVDVDDDDDNDEYFDENYDDYDEAEEYYDARHSLYV